MRFFARNGGPAATAPGRHPAGLISFATNPPPTSSGDSATVEDDYQEAIELVGNDSLSDKVRLLYKKVIARFLAEVDNNRPIALAERVGRHKALVPIDIEFAEADRTLKTLSTGLQNDLELYGAIAEACMLVRASALPRKQQGSTNAVLELTNNSSLAVTPPPAASFAPQAVEKLRTLVAKNAVGCDQLIREKVEMLLLAHELLLNPTIEPAPAKRVADSTRMMAMLGESTNVASHAELSLYFERFQMIASAQLATNVADITKQSVRRNRESLRPIYASQETVLFLLRLGPRLELKITADRREPVSLPTTSDDAPQLPQALSKMP